MSKNVGPSNVLSVVASAAATTSSLTATGPALPIDIKICNSSDYQLAAKSILSRPLYEYLASGTDDVSSK